MATQWTHLASDNIEAGALRNVSLDKSSDANVWRSL